MSEQPRIVVFTGNLSWSVRKGLVDIDRHLPGVSWLIVVHSPPRTPRRLLRNQWLNLKRNGWRWVFYQGDDIVRRLFARPSATPIAQRTPGSEFALDRIESMPNVRIVTTGDIHGEESLRTVRDFAPDLGLSLAAPILRAALFSIPRLGTINLHKGKVPDYRGMPPAFWELWNDESVVGCTVHQVDAKLDTGAIIGQTLVARSRFSTVRGLQLQLDEIGVVLMRDAAVAVLRGEAAPMAQPPGGKSFRKPTLAQSSLLDDRLLEGQRPGHSGPRRLVKRVLLSVGFMLWRTGLIRFFRPRVTVVLYHRVADDARDNLTVGIEQFDRQMALVARYCQPISIEEVARLQDVPRTKRPLVAVTFDDGYRDNYENAAPILERHGIPAAFYVSTGLIGSEAVFPHDVVRGNARIPVMTWDQLRAMTGAGFTIGSHTVNHIDCAAEPEDRVRDELARSRDDLDRELGFASRILGYPYGGRQHMTPQRLGLVKDASFVACLSAYGGSNVGSVDRFNVLRRGIHWEFSDEGFLFECLGLR